MSPPPPGRDQFLVVTASHGPILHGPYAVALFLVPPAQALACLGTYGLLVLEDIPSSGGYSSSPGGAVCPGAQAWPCRMKGLCGAQPWAGAPDEVPLGRLVLACVFESSHLHQCLLWSCSHTSCFQLHDYTTFVLLSVPCFYHHLFNEHMSPRGYRSCGTSLSVWSLHTQVPPRLLSRTLTKCPICTGMRGGGVKGRGT